MKKTNHCCILRGWLASSANKHPKTWDVAQLESVVKTQLSPICKTISYITLRGWHSIWLNLRCRLVGMMKCSTFSWNLSSPHSPMSTLTRKTLPATQINWLSSETSTNRYMKRMRKPKMIPLSPTALLLDSFTRKTLVTSFFKESRMELRSGEKPWMKIYLPSWSSVFTGTKVWQLTCIMLNRYVNMITVYIVRKIEEVCSKKSSRSMQD